eukprot:1997511-Rhodomonas_salina.1
MLHQYRRHPIAPPYRVSTGAVPPSNRFSKCQVSSVRAWGSHSLPQYRTPHSTGIVRLTDPFGLARWAGAHPHQMGLRLAFLVLCITARALSQPLHRTTHASDIRQGPFSAPPVPHPAPRTPHSSGERPCTIAVADTPHATPPHFSTRAARA